MELTFELTDEQREAVMSEATDSPEWWAEVEKRVTQEMSDLHFMVYGDEKYPPLTICVWADDGDRAGYNLEFTLEQALGTFGDEFTDDQLRRHRAELLRLVAKIDAELSMA